MTLAIFREAREVIEYTIRYPCVPIASLELSALFSSYPLINTFKVDYLSSGIKHKTIIINISQPQSSPSRLFNSRDIITHKNTLDKLQRQRTFSYPQTCPTGHKPTLRDPRTASFRDFGAYLPVDIVQVEAGGRMEVISLP
jgi:hypothetical protein